MSFEASSERQAALVSKQEVAILVYKYLRDEGYTSSMDSLRKECQYVKRPPKLVRCTNASLRLVYSPTIFFPHP